MTTPPPPPPPLPPPTGSPVPPSWPPPSRPPATGAVSLAPGSTRHEASGADRPSPMSRVRDDTARPADVMVVVAAATFGLGATVWVQNEVVSLTGTVFFVLATAALLASGRLASVQSRVLVALVPLFAVWLAIRTSPWLLVVDVVVASGLILAGVASSTSGRLTAYGLRDMATMPAHGARQARDTVGFAMRALSASGGERRRRQGVAVGIGVGLALPVVVVLGSLLASGDAAFASMMDRVLGGAAGDHAVVFAVATVIGLALVRIAAGADAEPRPAQAPLLGAVESVTVLVAMVVLYGLFALAQVVGSVAPDGEVLESAKATSAWVHRGFFPLLWASAITLGVLVTLRTIGRRSSSREQRWFVTATLLVVALTLVVVAVAVHRIVGYSDVFGLTMLRLHSLVFACWIGVVFVLFALATVGVGHGRRWFVGACISVGLVAVFALNLADPEARIVRFDTADLARYDETYLASLSDDAIPALVAALDSLPAERATGLASRLCSEAADRPVGGLDWNRSRAAARDALAGLCGR